MSKNQVNTDGTANAVIGKPVDRVDGRLKVTGRARYAAEFPINNLVYGVLVRSTVAKGRIKSMNTKEAERAPGVLLVMTHLNAPKLPFGKQDPPVGVDPKVGHHLRVLQSDVIHFNGQPIGVVVADTLERATHAAALVQVTYDEERHATRVEDELTRAFPLQEATVYPNEQYGARLADYSRGNPDALAAAEVRADHSYTIPIEHHNAMEPHATIALWEGQGGAERLTLYDKSQWVRNARRHVALTFGLPEERVRVICPFIGGAFGIGLRVWAHTVVAAMAARALRRPVKLVLTRQQVFTVTGYRPYTIQRVALGASRDGRLTAIVHEATANTSPFEEYTEAVLDTTRALYACPNCITTYRLVRTNINTPTPMRGPGEASGCYALESAMDELAYALKLDPLELRLRNHADTDPEANLPWSSKSLKECYQQGAAKFGWARRTFEPRSMRDGRYLVGLGMATATWPAFRAAASAMARILADGTALVQSATSDMGPGTYTAQTMIAADALGLPLNRVRFELGESSMPNTPPHGGSMTTASVGSAVHEACLAARGKALALARADARSPLHGAGDDEIAVADGRAFLKRDPSRGETYAEILARSSLSQLEATAESNRGEEGKQYSMRAFGAHFVEVRVDPDLGQVRVARIVSAIGAGRIVNPKTARSQLTGGMVGAIGMALTEETHLDHRYGRIINPSLAEYHVPVNADVPDIETIFIEEADPHVNPLGAKGVGEIAIIGAAAIVNAIFHATGKRVRDLPITPDKLL